MKTRSGRLCFTSILVLAGILALPGCDDSDTQPTTDTRDAVTETGPGDLPVEDDPGTGADAVETGVAELPVDDAGGEDVSSHDLPQAENPGEDANPSDTAGDVPVADVAGEDVTDEDVTDEDVAGEDVAGEDVTTPDAPDSEVPVAPLEIAGSYTDGWGTAHEITSQTWTMAGMGVFHVAGYDNDGNWLVAQNDAANAYSPGLWSRMDWSETQGKLYFCQTAYAAASRQEAEDTPAADATDPTASGCGGFAWTELTPAQP